MGLDISKEINTSQSGQKIVVLQISGELKQENLAVLDNIVNNLYDDGVEYLILDIEQVTSISSSGLGLLINLTQLPGAQNGIRLINAQNKFKVLFELLGLGDRLKILDNKENAINSWN